MKSVNPMSGSLQPTIILDAARPSSGASQICWLKSQVDESGSTPAGLRRFDGGAARDRQRACQHDLSEFHRGLLFPAGAIIG
jgi:hypothetical protein